MFKARCSSLTLCRGFSWLSVPKGCYGLHEATFFSESKSKSTQQTVKLKDIKIRRLLLFVFFPKICETFGTSVEILWATSWQRLCPLAQRSWQPASPRCCCNPPRGTCSQTSWRRQIIVAERIVFAIHSTKWTGRLAVLYFQGLTKVWAEPKHLQTCCSKTVAGRRCNPSEHSLIPWLEFWISQQEFTAQHVSGAFSLTYGQCYSTSSTKVYSFSILFPLVTIGNNILS